MFTLPEKFKQQAAPQKISGLLRTPWPYFGFALIVVATTVFVHTIPQSRELQTAKDQIAQNEEQRKRFEEDIGKKEIELKDRQRELVLYEDKYRPRIDKVLPYEEGIGELTRFLERFSLQLEKTGPIELSTISYGSPSVTGEYSALPIRLSFQANNVNFVRFMQMVKNSGSLDDKDFYEGEPVRLMEVNRISVSIPSFENGKPSEEQLYSINLELNAFFRNSISI